MLTLHRHTLGLKALAFSPGGTTLAACGQRGTVQVWDLPTRTLVHDLNVTHPVQGVFFLSETRIGVTDPAFVTFDLAYGAAKATPVGDRIARIAPSPARDAIAVGSLFRLARWPLPVGEGPAWETRQEDGYYNVLVWSPDGRTIAACGWEGTINLFDAATGQPSGALGRPGASAVTALAWSPDGATLVWCGGTRLHWRRGTDEAYHSLGRTHFLDVAWHPSGAFFATANGDGKVDYWDAATFERLESYDWGHGKLHAVAFDAAGDRAACCGVKGKVVVWDVDR